MKAKKINIDLVINIKMFAEDKIQLFKTCKEEPPLWIKKLLMNCEWVIKFDSEEMEFFSRIAHEMVFDILRERKVSYDQIKGTSPSMFHAKITPEYEYSYIEFFN